MSDYAAKTRYKKPLVHGMLAVSVFSGVMGMHFPGEGSIVSQREIRFIRPVFQGEKYVMHFKITEVDLSTHEGVIKSVLKNEKGQVCINGVSRIINAMAFSGSSELSV
jgi:acyl dehydratase